MHQWYRVHNLKIMDNHNIAICSDKTVHNVQLPLAEPNKTNAIETFVRLSIQNSQAKANHITNAQPVTHSHNNNKSRLFYQMANLTLFYTSST